MKAGFSLIEILVVITIIGLLVAVSGGAYSVWTAKAEVAKAKTIITELEEYASDYNDRRGDYPPSSLKDLGIATTGDEANEGIEAFVQAIFSDRYDGHRPDSTGNLINADADEADKKRTVFQSAELLEFKDAWNQPLIYIRHSDYGNTFTYLINDEPVRVQAIKNPQTRTYYKFESCQIMSAGPDLEWDTPDDVANFDRALEDDE